LFNLIEVVREPGFLGQAIAQSVLREETRKQLLVRALKSVHDNDQMFARGIVATWHHIAGREWAEALFDEALQGAWGDKAILTILLALPSAGWVWTLARRAGKVIERSYWTRLNMLWSREDADPAYAIEKLIEVGRARASVQFIGMQLH